MKRWILLTSMCVLSLCIGCGSSGGDAGTATSAVDSAGSDAGASGDTASATDANSPDANSSDANSPDGAAATDTSGAAAADAASGVCGAVTALGVCEGSLLKWCSSDGKKLEQEDCKDYFGKDQVGTCIKIDDAQGYFCAAKVGDSCLTQLDDGDLVAEYCGGKAPGCVYGVSTAVCKENLFSCTDKDVATCKNNYAIWDCNLPQPTVTDCTSFKAKCGVKDGVAVCTGVAAGGECDDYDIFCADGLKCTGADDESWGTCGK